MSLNDTERGAPTFRYKEFAGIVGTLSRRGQQLPAIVPIHATVELIKRTKNSRKLRRATNKPSSPYPFHFQSKEPNHFSVWMKQADFWGLVKGQFTGSYIGMN